MQLKRNLLSVALASATMMLANAAHAQSTEAPADAANASPDANQLDTIVVTGIRKGIQDSIDTKKSESTISEAVSSEDIGKLPDQPIPDSIAPCTCAAGLVKRCDSIACAAIVASGRICDAASPFNVKLRPASIAAATSGSGPTVTVSESTWMT